MQSYKMWIGGTLVNAESGNTYTTVNPATEEAIGKIPMSDKADVEKAVASARNAFPIWSQKTQEERSEIVNRIAVVIKEHAEELGELSILDHGLPRSSAFVQAIRAAQRIEWASQASKALQGDLITLNPSKKILFQREPLGVNALILPWNAPLMSLASKLGPCISVGNTCIIKPPRIESLAIIKLAEILDKLNIVPPGTINVVTGPGNTVGELLSSHPDVSLISFTGSSETGKRIMELGSQTMKRMVMELGGKNPVIVLDDADVDLAVSSSVTAQLNNSGQICASPGRFYIYKKIYDKFVEKLVIGMKNFIVGDPNDEKTQMGPVVSDEHRDKIEGLIKKGIEEGANLILGGKRPTEPPLNKGYYVMPTVFTHVKQNMAIAKEEIFGPVACIMEPFSTDEEAIALANDSVFGLSAYIWTRDMVRGLHFADKLCAGTVNINRAIGSMVEVPWGGFKQSGIGKEFSKYGLEEYTQLKVISIDIA